MAKELRERENNEFYRRVYPKDLTTFEIFYKFEKKFTLSI